MKKYCIIVCLFVIACAANAQQATATTLPDNMKWMHVSSGYPNNIHTRAIRDFLQRTKPAPDAEWAAIPKGFVVKYVIGNRRHRTLYNKKGDFLYTIRQYSEQEMTKENRRLIKSRYFDYTITLVEEIEQPSQPLTYVVHMEDTTTILNVTVVEGEVDNEEEFTKG